MEWCRLYGEMLDDPKVGTLNDAEYRTWIELLLVATKADANGSTKITPQSLDWVLRRNASVTLQVLLQRELVTLDETGVIVINAWEDRQKRSDSSAERVKKFREKQRLSSSKEDVTLPKRDANGLEKIREEKIREEPLKAEARASRLPADWKPNESDVSFCRKERPDLLPDDVANQFRDYWIAQPGAKGKKTDWQATWRNWVRNQRSPNGPRQSGSFHDERADTIAALTGRNRGYEHDDRTIDLPTFRLASVAG